MYGLLTKLTNATGILGLFRQLNLHNFSILTYHGIRHDEDKNNLTKYTHLNVPVSRFQEQALYLKKKYRLISISEGIDHIRNSEPLPPRSLAITFDDGYLNNYDLAYPICKGLDIPMTMYVATDFIINQDILWTDRLMLAIANTKKNSLNIKLNQENLTFNIFDSRGKDQAHFKLLQHLKSINALKINSVLDSIEDQLNVKPTAHDTSSIRPCRWDNLKEMADSGIVEIGAHTAGHRILTRLSENDCKHELQTSKNEIEKNLNRACDHFAYPNGLHGDFSKDTERWIDETGFKSAVTTVEGFNNHLSNPLALNRFGIFGHYSHSDFVSMISGFHDKAKRILGRSAS